MTNELKIEREDGHPREIGQIDYVHLGMEDHGFFTFEVGFDFGGSHQGLGHRVLAAPNAKEGKKFTAAGIEFLYRFIRSVGARNIDSLKGRRVVVLRDSDQPLTSRIIGVEQLPPDDPNTFLFDEVNFENG